MSLFLQKRVAQFDEVGVQVGHAGIDAVEAFERGLVLAEHLLTNPGGIADDYVKAGLRLFCLSLPVKEDFGKLQFPVEKAARAGYGGGSLQPLLEGGKPHVDAARGEINERLP